MHQTCLHFILINCVIWCFAIWDHSHNPSFPFSVTWSKPVIFWQMLAFLLVEVTHSIQVLAQDKEESRELYNWLFSIKNSGIHEDKVWEHISFLMPVINWPFYSITAKHLTKILLNWRGIGKEICYHRKRTAFKIKSTSLKAFLIFKGNYWKCLNVTSGKIESAFFNVSYW